MALHLPRSDGGIGCREKGHDEMVLSIILLGIVNGPVKRRGKSEIECLSTHQLRFLLRSRIRKRKKE